MIKVSITQLQTVRKIIAHAEKAIEVETSTPVHLQVVQMSQGKIGLEQLLSFVANWFGLQVSQLTERSRKREMVDARRCYVMLAADLLDMPFTHIGESMNRVHTSAMNLYYTGHGLMDANDMSFKKKYTPIYRAFNQECIEMNQSSENQQ